MYLGDFGRQRVRRELAGPTFRSLLNCHYLSRTSAARMDGWPAVADARPDTGAAFATQTRD